MCHHFEVKHQTLHCSFEDCPSPHVMFSRWQSFSSVLFIMSCLLVIANKNYSSWSMRIWVLMAHFDIPFQEKVLYYHQTDGKPQPNFLEFSPHGKVPCLHHTVIPEEKPLIVWDSLAITEYLADTNPTVPIWPATLEARTFARCAAAEMHSSFTALRDELSYNLAMRIELQPDDASEGLLADLRRMDTLWKEGLRRFGGPYIGGREFCAADAFFVPVAARLRTFVGMEAVMSEEGREYARTLSAVPAVERWVEGALAETQINEWKEDDCIRGRKVLEGLRKSG